MYLYRIGVDLRWDLGVKVSVCSGFAGLCRCFVPPSGKSGGFVCFCLFLCSFVSVVNYRCLGYMGCF